MRFGNFFSLFTSHKPVGLIAFVVLASGAGIAVVASQQQQDNRSRAAFVEVSDGGGGGPVSSGYTGTNIGTNTGTNTGSGQVTTDACEAAKGTCKATSICRNASGQQVSDMGIACPANVPLCCYNFPQTQTQTQIQPPGGSSLPVTSGGGDADPASQPVGDVVYNGSLPSSLNNAGPYYVDIPVEVGVKYKIVVSGWYRYQRYTNYNSTTDAQWDDWLKGSDNCFCRPVNKVNIDGHEDRAEDGQDHSTGNHAYTWHWTADKTNLRMYIPDGTYHHDNLGDLWATVTVAELPNIAPIANAGADQTITLQTSVSATNVSLTGSGTDTDGTIADYTWTKTSGPSGESITSADTASTIVTGLVVGVYKFKLEVTDNGGAKHSDEVTVTVNPATENPTPQDTTFNFNLLFHGIGKGGDNKNPYEAGDPLGNVSLQTNPRPVKVEVYDLDQNLITTKDGQVTYNSEFGGYKGTVAMGTTLEAQPYQIRVKFTHSIWSKPIARQIKAGEVNDIPVIYLVNGDANNDARLDILDYDIIVGCIEDPDFNEEAPDCNPTKKLQANIDDDDKVYYWDLTLLLREMSVQGL